MSNSKLTYRSEIDGLRAIAVLSVLIYHADFNLNSENVLPGGYLGVDLFFVLSGYLISKILYLELSTQPRINFFNFYLRRSRRILPVLLFIILVSVPFALKVLPPSVFLEYSDSLASSLLFFANFYFYFDSTAYSDQASQLKPFLHTWSLSVEEQFYLIFPFVIIFIKKVCKNWAFPILLVLFSISLIYSQHLVNYNVSANFYLPFSRVWELLAGCLLASHEVSNQRFKANSFLSSIGLFLISVSLFSFSESTRHPGLITLIPIIGVVMLIAFLDNKIFVGRVLSTKLLVYIGLVSYSIYLWHFPIFAFGRLILENFGFWEKALLIGLTLSLSIVSYFLIEKPFRNKSKVPTSLFILITSSTFILILLGSAISRHTNGADFRLNDKIVDNYNKYFVGPEHYMMKDPSGGTGSHIGSDKKMTMCTSRHPDQACRIGNVRFVTLGDSFVGHYERRLLEILTDQDSPDGLISLSYDNCPFVGIDFRVQRKVECPYVNRRRLEIIKELEGPRVFIIAANTDSFDEVRIRTKDPLGDMGKGDIPGELVDPNLVWESYFENIRKLTRMGHRVILIRSLPYPFINGERIDVKGEFYRILKDKPLDDIEVEFSDVDPVLIRSNDDKNYPTFEDSSVLVIDPIDSLCTMKQEYKKCKIIDERGGLYNYGNHFSYFGADLVLKDIFFKIKKNGW